MNILKPLILAVTIATITAIQSCKTDFELYAPYDDIPVVYAILDQSVDTQYVKVNKTYLGQGDNASYASINDSVLFDNVVVTVSEYVNGSLTTTFPCAEKWVTEVESGIFYGGGTQKVYSFATPSGGLNVDAKYELNIDVDNGRKIVTAETNLIGDFGFAPTFRNKTNVGLSLFRSSGSEYKNVTMAWTPAVGALKYEAEINFIYKDSTATGSEIKTINWKLGKATGLDTQGGGGNLSKEILGENFYLNIKNKLANYANEANIVSRHFIKLEYVVASAGKDLSTYIAVNEPSNSIVTNRPSFSNVDGGLGIFSSRVKIVLDNAAGQNLLLSSQSLAHLKTGQHTHHLKFQ